MTTDTSKHKQRMLRKKAAVDKRIANVTEEQRQFPDLQLRNYLITDGRSTQNITDIQSPGEWILVDIEQSSVKRGRGHEFARNLNADYHSLDMMKA